MRLNDTTVSGNSSDFGGGILNAAVLTLNDSTVSGFAADAERAPDSAAPASPTTSAVASSRRRRLLWTLVFRSLEERLAARTPTVERECAAAEAERDH